MDVYVHASFLQFTAPDINFPRSYWYVQGESWIEQLGNPSLEQIESSSRDKAPREHPSSWRSWSFPRVYSSLSERGLRSVGEGTNHSFLFKSSTLVFFNNIGFVKWYMIMIQTNHTTEKCKEANLRWCPVSRLRNDHSINIFNHNSALSPSLSVQIKNK